MKDLSKEKQASGSEKKLTAGLWKIGRYQMIAAFVIIVAALVMDQRPLGWFIGCAAGLSDNGLFLYAIARGLKKEPRRSALYMHRMMYVRLLCLAAYTIVAIRGHWDAGKVMISFIIFYVTLLIQMARLGVNNSK
jgi:hypothetical protein